MKSLNNRQINILEIIRQEKNISSSDVFNILTKKENISLVTIKRDLSKLLKSGHLEKTGKGRSVIYKLSIQGEILSPIDAKIYCAIDIDKRSGAQSYDFKLFSKITFDLFSKEEKVELDNRTKEYKIRIKNAPKEIHKKELERFIIELSWKSSKIEGNTYTLLDTERLIREGIPAKGHKESETIMILNHKKAFEFIMEREKDFSGNIKHNLIEEIHKKIVSKLNINFGIRKSLVGITGTVYKPLDNQYQIREALEELYKLINNTNNPYKKALLIILGMSYIQPFEDGNKRTARLLANAILLAHKYAPLSYRSVDEVNYREAILVFYETHSIMPMKKIFIEQYIFSTNTYLVE